MFDEKKCYLATRIAKRFNPIDRFLKHQLKSDFIHSEILFPRRYHHNSFSSRGRFKNTRKKIKGVQFDIIDYSKGKWRFDDLALTNEQIDLLYIDCNSWIGADYDTKGAILMAGFGLDIEDEDKFWCQKFVLQYLLNYLNLKIFILRHNLYYYQFSYSTNKRKYNIMAWYNQYQYAEVIDPMYRNLNNKALPIIRFDIVDSEKKVLAVELSFGNNSSQWFEQNQVILYKSGKELIGIGQKKRDIGLFNKISKIFKLKG